MTITLVFLNQSFLVQPEIVSALRRVPGITTIAFDITAHPCEEQARAAAAILRERRCNLLFTVNEWGIDAGGILQEYLESARIVHINWCVDDPFYEAIMQRRKFRPSSRRIDFVSDRDYVIPMRAARYNAHFLPLGVDPQLYHPAGKPFERDCAFVGNSYLAQIDEFTRGAEGLLDGMVPFLAQTMQQYYRDATVDIGGVLSEYVAKHRLPEGISREKAAFIAKHFAGYLFRRQIVGALVAALPGFELFGDDGWLQAIEKCVLNRRKVRYGSGLCDVYATTKVNIDINRVVIRSGFTQRIFDTLAAGAFVITSAKPIVGEFFATGGKEQEVAMFSGSEELVDKVRFFLAHEEERTAIALRGMRRVLATHTYDHRIREIFRVVAREMG